MESELERCNSSDARRSMRRMRIGFGVLAVVGVIVGLAVWPAPIGVAERFPTGLEAVKRGDWKTVRLCAHHLQQDDEHQAHAFLLQGYDLKASGQFEDAFVTFSKANSHTETREFAYHEAASMLYDSRQYSQVILMCRQVLEWNSGRTDTQRLLAAAYYDIGAMVQAINTLQVVIEQQPDDYRPHYMQASILHDFERFDDAALAYEQAADRIPPASPARDEVLAGWGACLVRLRRHKEALDAMIVAANGPEIEAQRAVALFALRQPEAALKAAESALQQNPLDPEAVAVAAQCYEHNGDADRGIALLKQAADLHPHELELHLRLADMLGANGQSNGALEHRKIAAKISEYRRDFSHKQQALVHDENDASLRFEIAQLAERLGKIEIARSWLHAAVGMASATDEIRSHFEQFQQRYPVTQNLSPTSVRGD
jgi:tetratricopeptide (TPR) repeat protein